MATDIEKEHEKSALMAQRHFRKDIDGFRQRRRLELEDLLRTEWEKGEELRDRDTIEWVLRELKLMDDPEQS